MENLKKFIKVDEGCESNIKVFDLDKMLEAGLINEDQYDEFDAYDGASKFLEFLREDLDKQGIAWCYTMGNCGEPFYSGGNCWESYPFKDYSGKDISVYDRDMFEEDDSPDDAIFTDEINIDEYDVVFVDRILE